MQEIVFQLENDNCVIEYYCVIDNNRLYVLPSKSLEKRVFWNEFSNYELKSNKILRVNNFKDNILSRLLGTTEKNHHIFDNSSDIGVMNFEYFSKGCVCVSIQKIYQEGMEYTCDFVACSTDTVNLFNFYKSISYQSLVWGSSPYHIRGRCSLDFLMKELNFDFFVSVSYVLREGCDLYILHREVYNKQLEFVKVWCTLHNEDLILKLEVNGC